MSLPHPVRSLRSILIPIELVDCNHPVVRVLLAAIQEPEGEGGQPSATKDVPQRHRYATLVDELANPEARPIEHSDRDEEIIRNAMLVAIPDEGPDRNPDGVNLGDVFVRRGGGAPERKPNDPVAADAAQEVHRPV